MPAFSARHCLLTLRYDSYGKETPALELLYVKFQYSITAFANLQLSVKDVEYRLWHLLEADPFTDPFQSKNYICKFLFSV